MSKTMVQRTETVLTFSGSLAAAASVSGSFPCLGHSRIVGTVFSTASSVAGSGLIVKQSIDKGVNFDYITPCSIAANSACNSAFSIEIVGDTVQVDYKNGATVAASVRMKWYLRPI